MNSWRRVTKTFAGRDVVVTCPGAAFTYQFANLWLPLDQLPPDNCGMDWWLNAYNAARCNYAFSMDPAIRAAYPTFDGVTFGPTACEDPSGRYHSFGAAPAGEITNLTSSDSEMVQAAMAIAYTNYPDFVNGTIAPYGAACFIEFMPQETLLALRHYVFDLGLWHNYYGFSDSFNHSLPQLLSKEIEIELIGVQPAGSSCGPVAHSCPVLHRSRADRSVVGQLPSLGYCSELGHVRLERHARRYQCVRVHFAGRTCNGQSVGRAKLATQSAN